MNNNLKKRIDEGYDYIAKKSEKKSKPKDAEVLDPYGLAGEEAIEQPSKFRRTKNLRNMRDE